MRKWPEEAAFNDAYRKRLKDLREARRLSQADMERELGLSKGLYEKYENRSPLPAYLIKPVCDVLKVPVIFLLTGSMTDAVPLDDNVGPLRARRSSQ